MIRALALVLLGGASFALVYWATAPEEADIDTPVTVGSVRALLAGESDDAKAPAADDVSFELRPTTEVPTQMIAQAGETQRAVRNVTPDDMTAAPVVTAPLVRVEAPAPAEKPKPARLERLFYPVVVAAGTLKVGERSIALAGIDVTSPDMSCGKNGSWPCGRLARAALRGFIRGRAIECEIPTGATSIPDPARCFVGGEDIAEWLVAQGWAAANGDEYAEAGDRAKQSKLGLFAAARPDAQPEAVARR